ncbi:MAG: hypothetical protein ACFBZ8_09900 [Opitutales bacterium]
MSGSTGKAMPHPLYSLIGYEDGLPIRWVFRGQPNQAAPRVHAYFQDGSGPEAVSPEYWGERWGSTWWCLDVLKVSGAMGRGIDSLEANVDDDVSGWMSPVFGVADLLWRETFEPVALLQAERRQRYCQIKPGWRDCGSWLQEANSHCVYLWGMFDLLEFAPERFTTESGQAQKARLLAQIDNGLACLCAYQDLARQRGLGDGALIHEPKAKPETVIRNDVVKAALTFARAARLLEDGQAKYLTRALRAFNWAAAAPAFEPDTFEPRAHGAPSDYRPKPTDWNASDLLHMAWAAFELSYLDSEYEAQFHDWLGRGLARQVPEAEAEDGLHGHFYAFDDHAFTENAWTHHGVSFDGGQTFAHVLFPLFRALERWPDHADAPKWKGALERFAYGFLLPACERNPFLICPLGVYGDEGLLEFAGLWHGMNAVYAFTAALAFEYSKIHDDDHFRAIAAGNLYWITGLNTGLTQDAIDLGSHMYYERLSAAVETRCMIYGLGPQVPSAGSWTTIPGSITNGFSVGHQFRHDIEPTKANDGPLAFNDEEWITHAGGWLAALARLPIPEST